MFLLLPGPFSVKTTLDWADMLDPVMCSSSPPSAEQLAGLKLSTRGSSCPERWAETTVSMSFFLQVRNIKM